MTMTTTTAYPWDIHTESRRKIDEEIIQLLERISSLRTARNTLAPISGLPPEVMGPILVLCQKEAFAQGRQAETTITLSSVSRHWRQIALSLPQMWSSIDITGADAVQVFSERASDHPLSFSIVFDYPEDHPTHRTEISHILNALILGRTVSLEIDASRNDLYGDHPRDFNDWTTPAPLLESLTVDGVDLPSNMFSGQSPNLSYVKIVDCDFHLTGFTFPDALTTLIINTPHPTIPASDFLQVLRQTPNLENLELQRALSLPTSTSLSHVQLPKLSRFNVNNEERGSLLWVLQQLDLPGNLDSIKINVSDATDVVSDDDLLGIVVDQFHLSSQNFKGFRIMVSPRYISLNLCEILPLAGLAKVEVEFNRVPRLQGSGDVQALLERLRDSISDVEEIEFEGLRLHGSQLDMQVIGWFSSFPSLHTMAVRSNSGPPFFAYLRQAINIMDSQSYAQPESTYTPFPSICKLQLNGILSGFWEEELEALRDWLKARQAISCGLSKLIVDSQCREKLGAWRFEDYVEEVQYLSVSSEASSESS